MPPSSELKEALIRLISISALAMHYKVAFATARKWLTEAGLGVVLISPEHISALAKLVSAKPTQARRKRIDEELEQRLGEESNRKLLARAIVDEFYIHYIFKKDEPWESYALTLTLMMYDFAPVKQVADLMGTPVRMRFRKSRSGARVPCWVIQITGYRAFRILELTRPYLVGQKAYQADVALRNGALTSSRISLEKALYKKALLVSVKNLPKKVPASGLREGSRTSLTP